MLTLIYKLVAVTISIILTSVFKDVNSFWVHNREVYFAVSGIPIEASHLKQKKIGCPLLSLATRDFIYTSKI
jgi:hypothetical protein